MLAITRRVRAWMTWKVNGASSSLNKRDGKHPDPSLESRGRGRRSTVGRVAVGVAVAATALVTGGASAHAAPGDYSYVLDATNVRSCGSTYAPCGIMGSVYGNQWDQTWCWRDGDWALGTNRWFKVTAFVKVNPTTHAYRTGWVSAALVPRQATVPYCSSWS